MNFSCYNSNRIIIVQFLQRNREVIINYAHVGDLPDYLKKGFSVIFERLMEELIFRRASTYFYLIDIYFSRW